MSDLNYDLHTTMAMALDDAGHKDLADRYENSELTDMQLHDQLTADELQLVHEAVKAGVEIYGEKISANYYYLRRKMNIHQSQ